MTRGLTRQCHCDAVFWVRLMARDPAMLAECLDQLQKAYRHYTRNRATYREKNLGEMYPQLSPTSH